MATLQELKEALDQGEDIMPLPRKGGSSLVLWEDCAHIEKRGEVYVYDPGHPESAPRLFTDFDLLMEALEYEWDYLGVDSLEWEILGEATPEEVSAFEQEYGRSLLESDEAWEEWKSFIPPEERENFQHPVTYNEVRNWHITFYKTSIRYAEAKGENAAHHCQILMDFWQVNPVRKE